jgi:hypothetical protein
VVFIQLASGSQGRSEGGGGAAHPQRGETRRRARECVVSTRNRGHPFAWETRGPSIGGPAPQRARPTEGNAQFKRRCAAVGVEETGNDPSAGSPTETLLRLLLPLNDKVWTASQGIAAGKPATLPRSGGLTGSFNR